MTTAPDLPPPLLRVVRGDPTPEELAALAAVLAARATAGAEPTAVAPSGWVDRAALLRQPLSHGIAAWRGSARPR